MIRLATGLAALFLATAAHAEPMVFAAASTGRALDAAIAESGLDALVSYGASGTIARQIEQGAPADLFLSANPKWMAHLAEEGLVDAIKVVPLMSNRLVLIAPAGAMPLALEAEAIEDRLAGENFVMADFQVAPVGRYGHTALVTLGLWNTVTPSYVPTRNTVATVAAVAQGEAALGLVYATDAKGVEGVEIVADIPASAHDPIRYLIAPIPEGEDPDGAATLLDFLLSDAGQAILSRFGFVPVGGAGS